jgi:tetratricopeptide (TPR) repeat protein
MSRLITLLLAVVTISVATFAQEPKLSPEQNTELQITFDTANKLLEQGKAAEALTHYRKALSLLPKDPALLFNGGMAAYASKDFNTALDLWKRLKVVDALDWHVRAKLIQTYQALEKTAERDAERAELFAMWKKGEPAELKQQYQYCREQFEVKGQKVMVFEHFELKGDRALRYVFSILDASGQTEDWRISLGSYNFTNAVWRETTKPTPKEGERLFHLDGYFKGGHATYDMIFPEPSYDDVRARVVKILEAKGKP